MDFLPSNELKAAVFEVLQTKPAGLSEYELMKTLQDSDKVELPQDAFRDNLSLFRVHFVVYHLLYQLRLELWHARRGHLEISPLRIVLLPYRTRGSQALAERDPLQDYYLDLENLADTSSEDVERMLGAFWQRLHAGDHRREALAVLELEDPVDSDAIRRQYRRLVMRHHPDRGGDKARLQALNHAMEVLARSPGP